MIKRIYQREYPWIKYGDFKNDMLDLEFEGLTPEQIKDKVVSIFAGKIIKDKYGSTLVLRSWEDMIAFLASIKTNKEYMGYLNIIMPHDLYNEMESEIHYLIDDQLKNGIVMNKEFETEGRNENT
jgi:hypothetical protein